MIAGQAMNLKKGWERSKEGIRKPAWNILEDRPRLEVASPPWTDQAYNQGEINKTCNDARSHTKFCAKVFRHQLRLHLAHEHPASERAWTSPTMRMLAWDARVSTVKPDLRMFGMKTQGPRLHRQIQFASSRNLGQLLMNLTVDAMDTMNIKHLLIELMLRRSSRRGCAEHSANDGSTETQQRVALSQPKELEGQSC